MLIAGTQCAATGEGTRTRWSPTGATSPPSPAAQVWVAARDEARSWTQRSPRQCRPRAIRASKSSLAVHRGAVVRPRRRAAAAPARSSRTGLGEGTFLYSVACRDERRARSSPWKFEILHAALSMQRPGDVLFHGFGLAQSMGEDAGGRLIGHGTLYKALGRLEEMGLLARTGSRIRRDGRPRRRQYELTASGTKAALAPRGRDERKLPSRPRLSPGTA